MSLRQRVIVSRRMHAKDRILRCVLNFQLKKSKVTVKIRISIYVDHWVSTYRGRLIRGWKECFTDALSWLRQRRPSVRPSHADSVSKRRKLRSWNLHCLSAPWRIQLSRSITLFHSWNSKGVTLTDGVKKRKCGNSYHKSLQHAYLRKARDRAKTRMRATTFDDLNCHTALCCTNYASFGADHGNTPCSRKKVVHQAHIDNYVSSQPIF